MGRMGGQQEDFARPSSGECTTDMPEAAGCTPVGVPRTMSMAFF